MNRMNKVNETKRIILANEDNEREENTGGQKEYYEAALIVFTPCIHSLRSHGIIILILPRAFIIYYFARDAIIE